MSLDYYETYLPLMMVSDLIVESNL